VSAFAESFKQNISWIQNYVGRVELIIVEDHSIDNSFAILQKLFSGVENVSVVQNIGYGKVAALNFGCSISSGKYVRFIDGDDSLLESAVANVQLLRDSDGDVLSSSFFIKLNKKMYPVTSKFMRFNGFSNAKFHSPPRWNWTIKKELALKVFPIPEELPFEDLYMAVKIVLKAKKLVVTPKIDYIYVQHDGQTYGGVHRSSHQLATYRADRNVRVLRHLETKLDLPISVKNLLENELILLSKKRNFKNFVLTNASLFAIAFKVKIFIDWLHYIRHKNHEIKVYVND